MLISPLLGLAFPLFILYVVFLPLVDTVLMAGWGAFEWGRNAGRIFRGKPQREWRREVEDVFGDRFDGYISSPWPWKQVRGRRAHPSDFYERSG